MNALSRLIAKDREWLELLAKGKPRFVAWADGEWVVAAKDRTLLSLRMREHDQYAIWRLGNGHAQFVGMNRTAHAA